jgi:hypothetical protein
MTKKTKNTAIAFGTVIGLAFASNAAVGLKESHEAHEKESREYAVEQAATYFLEGRIEVEEYSKEGQLVQAELLMLGGATIYSECQITYEIHSDDHRTFHPDTLDISSCLPS